MVAIVLPLVFGLITAVLARRKGYNPFLWFFAAGIIGLIVLAFLPFANKEDLPEEKKAQLTKQGNIIGCIFAGLLLLLWVVRFIVVLG